MLSSMHILSLKQGKLYGDRVPIEALPHGFTLPRLVVLFALIVNWSRRTKKDPAETGPEVAEPHQAAPVI